MDEIARAKSKYAQQIEDGRKISVIASLPEWNWYVEKVIQPTIDEYTERILAGEIPSDKEDWIIRGMIMGMRLVVNTTDTFQQQAKIAKKQAKDLVKYERSMEDE